MADIHFQQLAERFERKIYGSEKGELRLALLWDDLQTSAPELFGTDVLNVLDAGGGLGQMSERLAKQGHRVVLAEPALAMLERARQLLDQAQVPMTQLQLLQTSIQQLPDHFAAGTFDVIVCHAVLEWLAEPLPTLQQLLGLLRPGGLLSLAFYNVDSIVFKNLLKGNINKIRANKLAGDPGSLTPQSPLLPPQVLLWLEQQGLVIDSVTGIRCLNDYFYPQVRLPPDEVYALERDYSRREPYKWLGRYIHVIARRSDG